MKSDEGGEGKIKKKCGGKKGSPDDSSHVENCPLR